MAEHEALTFDLSKELNEQLNSILDIEQNDISFTGERVVINKEVKKFNKKVMNEHIERYKFACSHIKNKLVLDAACGTGYGTRMLKTAGAEAVTGIDISKETIFNAQRTYQCDKVNFIQGDINCLPFENGTFDIVVSFETLEHIADGTVWIKESARVLKNGGLFIVSTPNRDITKPGATINDILPNPYHRFEYNENEFITELSKHYDILKTYGQNYFDKTPAYLIALCRKRPKISIVIPAFNQLQYTVNCIDSIKNNQEIPLEIIIVDNGSEDGTAEHFQSDKDVSLIKNESNLGFSKACNQGFSMSKGEYVVFLNNDTLVTNGWLSAMVNCIEGDKDIGVVGSKLLYPRTGKIQHAGVVFGLLNDCVLPYHIYQNQRSGHLAVNKTRQFKAVTGACMMVRRKAFEQAGGFDEMYLNGHEDIDLCLTIGEAGWKVFYCAESIVYHYESISPGRFENASLNAERFLQKWRDKMVIDDYLYYQADGIVRSL